MSKTEEIEILRRAANRLGNDSYCGAWLRSIVDEVERSVRCDILPELSISGTEKKCQEMLAEARKQAEEIKEAARQCREREVKRAQEESAAIRWSFKNQFRNDIDNLVYALQDFKNSR